MATDRYTRCAFSRWLWPGLHGLHAFSRRMVLYGQQGISLWFDSFEQEYCWFSLSISTTIPPYTSRLQIHASDLECYHATYFPSGNPPHAISTTTNEHSSSSPSPPKPFYPLALPQTPHNLHLQPRNPPPILRLRTPTNLSNHIRPRYRCSKPNISNTPPNTLQSTWNPLKLLLRLA